MPNYTWLPGKRSLKLDEPWATREAAVGMRRRDVLSPVARLFFKPGLLATRVHPVERAGLLLHRDLHYAVRQGIAGLARESRLPEAQCQQ
ncbi:hypothetical protein [Paraburkholderia sp. LEh10]|uniref:hypothetical protein n=1 Tax=Paraburkholderia sp. LEh10 TaxID=2821353 RepID=UPI001FD7B495|nr:hypothetical protein [Paraburkholderia sp. LEh10]